MRLIYAVCFLTITGLAFTQVGCGNNSDTSNENGDEDEASVPVEVATVHTGDISAYLTGTATLEAEEETEIVAKVGGIVKEIFVEEGDYVEAGQVLAKLDDEKLAVLLEQERANLKKLESDYLRNKELFDKGLVSTEVFQASQYEYEYQREAFNLAKLELHYTSIRAPISGFIAERLIKIGNMVLLNQATFRVTGFEPLLAILHVPERHSGKLRVGQVAKLSVDALESAEYAGNIERISPVVDPATGTVKVTIAVTDPARKLKPGMFARISITYDVHENAMLVPKDAIITEDRESVVFVVRDSVAYRQTVETGYVNRDKVEVVKGLKPGDIIVTTGKGSLKDSARVELVSNKVAGHATVD